MLVCVTVLMHMAIHGVNVLCKRRIRLQRPTVKVLQFIVFIAAVSNPAFQQVWLGQSVRHLTDSLLHNFGRQLHIISRLNGTASAMLVQLMNQNNVAVVFSAC